MPFLYPTNSSKRPVSPRLHGRTFTFGTAFFRDRLICCRPINCAKTRNGSKFMPRYNVLTDQQYVGLKFFQSRIRVAFASGKRRVTASGTYPVKAGKTGSIPKARIRSSILCCNSTCLTCQLAGSGPPHPCMLPIRDLQQYV